MLVSLKADRRNLKVPGLRGTYFYSAVYGRPMIKCLMSDMLKYMLKGTSLLRHYERQRSFGITFYAVYLDKSTMIPTMDPSQEFPFFPPPCLTDLIGCLSRLRKPMLSRFLICQSEILAARPKSHPRPGSTRFETGDKLKNVAAI